MEVRKAVQTVGKYWLSIGFIGLVIGYIPYYRQGGKGYTYVYDPFDWPFGRAPRTKGDLQQLKAL